MIFFWHPFLLSVDLLGLDFVLGEYVIRMVLWSDPRYSPGVQLHLQAMSFVASDRSGVVP